MARLPGGSECVDAAFALLREAQSAEQLRQAQAVLLPLLLGLSIEQTALAIGRSASVTCSMRTRFARIAQGLQRAPHARHELRNRAHSTLERERQIIGRVVGHARSAGVALVPRLRAELEADLGHAVALSSVYRLLQRHGWQREVLPPPPAVAGTPVQPERRRRPAPRWIRV
jgi:transposase